MNGFNYTLTLQEPVLANSLGGEPNSANSLYYIPGGLIRGAAISAYTGTKDAGDSDFSRLFLNGKTRFLNAYPLSEKNRTRSLPTPLKYRKPKYFSGGDLSSIKNASIDVVEELFQINIHTQRDAELGHAIENAGAVYRYIALPAGLTLQGAVLTETKADADTIERLLVNQTILLGKARTAGYGRALLKIEPLNLNESGSVASGQVTHFTISLLSPAIVRDMNGQATLDISHALKTRLGVDVTLNDKETYQHAEIVGGFNRTWGLPLPQVTAISAGSSFEVDAIVGADKLKELEETGIGERRAEGFGRVAVNMPLPKEIKDDDWLHVDPQREDLAQSQNSAGENATAKLMLKRIARKDLDEKIIHTAREMTGKYVVGSVPNSQLSRWRVIVRDVLGKQDENGKRDAQRLIKFRDDSKGKTGWKKMEKARVILNNESPRLTEWISDLLDHSEKLYDALKIKPDYQHAIGDNTFKMNEDLNLEYRLRLMDAVLAMMAKKNGGSNE